MPLPLPHDRLHVYALFSGGASGLVGLLEGPGHGRDYDIAGALTDKAEASGIGRLAGHDRPVQAEVLDYQDFCRQEGLPPGAEARTRYHREVAGRARRAGADTIILAGYFQVVPEEFLQEFPRTLNVHPAPLHYIARKQPPKGSVGYADLRDCGNSDPREIAPLVGNQGAFTRAFRGGNAPHDVLIAGHAYGVHELRATVHQTTPDLDLGPILVESAPLPIDRERVGRNLRNRNWAGIWDYGRALQDQLKDQGDIPAFREALHLLAHRRLSLSDGLVWLDGQPLPYKGHQMNRPLI
ncbi:MAG: hypothetical protein HY520_01170 [Candidatus Aenigmarchaeota archaeon]|nr:hypothetical protein [Candidatus Aenigmarchaeota archaeon]